MKDPSVQKSQIDALIKDRFPYISTSLAQKVSQLTHHKHLYRIANNNKPVLLINRIKQVAQDQSTPADVRRFLASQFSLQSTKSILQEPIQKRWDDYVSGAREIYKNRNYLVYPTGNKRKLFQVDIQRGGISVNGPTMSKQGDHRLQIRQGGNILLDGNEPMTPSERNAAMELMGELFGQLKIHPEWAKTKQNIIKTFVAGKIYKQGQTKPEPYLTMPVHDFATLRTTLKSMKSMQYPQQQQNRLISAITHKDKELQSYKQVRNALVPLLKTYQNLSFFEQVKKLILKVPITPWVEFWRDYGEEIYNTENTYNIVHEMHHVSFPHQQLGISDFSDRNNGLLFPQSSGKMLLWTFDVKKKAIIIVIRGMGFEWKRDREYERFESGRLWKEPCEIVIDISENRILILITSSDGTMLTKLWYTIDKLKREQELDANLTGTIGSAIDVYKGIDPQQQAQRNEDGDNYYVFPDSYSEYDDAYICFLPSKSYRRW